MHNVRGYLHDLVDALRENQSLMAVLSAIAGAFLAIVLERAVGDPESESIAITVAQARTSLLSALALIFTGLSIVLALTTIATQNMANKFSPRLLRMKLRGSGNKTMLAVFSLTASFIITSQILLRTRDGDSLAPEPTMLAAVALVVVTGVVIIWYINDTIQSLRVDRTINWLGRHIVRAADARRRAHHDDEVVEAPGTDRPSGATDLSAPTSGYLVDVDTDQLLRLATSKGVMITIDRQLGQPLVRGEAIGWSAAASGSDDAQNGQSPGDIDLGAFAGCLTIADVRDPDSEVGYTMSALVDVALMALSPAVNDPHTAVQTTEMLTAVFIDLADHRLGTLVRRDEDGAPVVTVRGRTLGDYLDIVGRQILLYGREDRSVTASLLWFAQEGLRVMTTDRDRDLAKALADDIEATRAQAGG